MKDDALLQRLGDRVRELESNLYEVTLERNNLNESNVQLRIDLLVSDLNVKNERDRSDRWQKLAGRYDDIRGWLRLCTDDQVGHSEFYRECCLIIFGEYRGETEVDNDD